MTPKNTRLKTCRHFNGIQNINCVAGVEYDSVKDRESSPFRWACTSDGVDLPCALREYPTPEDIKAEDKAIALAVANAFTVRSAILKQTGGGRNLAGRIDCPICGYGVVTYGVSYNWHIHAKCSTDECVSFME